jgi:hypothetical protein
MGLGLELLLNRELESRLELELEREFALRLKRELVLVLELARLCLSRNRRSAR